MPARAPRPTPVLRRPARADGACRGKKKKNETADGGKAGEPKAKKLTPKEKRALAKAEKEAAQKERLEAIEAKAAAMKKPCDEVQVVMWTLSLATSFQKATGRQLLRGVPVTEASRALYETQDFVLLSHSCGEDADVPEDGPVFNYGNELGQELFGYGWDELTQISSSKTVKADNEDAAEKRKELMARMDEEDFAEFDGVRVDKDGNEFLIEKGILWNVRAPPKASGDDAPMEGKRKEAEQGPLVGQAAVFWRWQPQPDGDLVERAGLPEERAAAAGLGGEDGQHEEEEEEGVEEEEDGQRDEAAEEEGGGDATTGVAVL